MTHINNQTILSGSSQSTTENNQSVAMSQLQNVALDNVTACFAECSPQHLVLGTNNINAIFEKFQQESYFNKKSDFPVWMNKVVNNRM